MASAWRRYYTLLHVFHLSVLLWMSLYFSLWYRSLKEQDVTGNPNTLTARWLPQLSQKIYDILELMMYLLTALGWQTSRPRLNRTEVRFAGVISTVSMYLGFFEITCTSEQVCAGYRLSRLILHSLAYLCIIVAVNFHLAVINNQIREAGISLDTGRMYQRFYAYSAFRVAFLLFIIQPTVMLFIQMSVFSWYEEWAVTLIYWLIKWLLLLAVAWSFKPRPKNLKLFNIAVADQRREFEEDDEQQQRDRGGEAWSIGDSLVGCGMRANEDMFCSADGRARQAMQRSLCALQIVKSDNGLHRITERLYVSSVSGAMNLKELRQHRISHILCVASGIRPLYPDCFTYKCADLLDADTESLLDILPSCLSWMICAQREDSENRILVHCFAGKSRSVGVLLAYLVLTLKIPLRLAFAHLRRMRPQCSPNGGFMEQLGAFEKEVLKADGLTSQAEGEELREALELIVVKAKKRLSEYMFRIFFG
ncbi:dual specificity protein phosphatase, putative [Perkinsus marinus ATCC 50983]|uniref:Dual specificity protein phosphatase, putative n=1 Tax=Perkinsus marinus (strain ATCC 50983 / TXsc) TaxID=423536 RepID=C5LZB2_PERM5|nr:dual specificity protein phosphatase, putative [Perkinsus marinus ATCC 50983]EEQ97906.1 dual specificity protein phosphatase, putative [Perkinsus marinus ATCC 50983]|eukprot:XP_002765189.1 dual specificity protein phosphatase, putative [Perkinsus marinus ATCC 50983]